VFCGGGENKELKIKPKKNKELKIKTKKKTKN